MSVSYGTDDFFFFFLAIDTALVLLLNNILHQTLKRTFIISQFLWVRHLGILNWVILGGGCSQTCNQGVTQGFGHFKAQMGRICFQAHSHGWWKDLLLYGLLGWASVPHWLLAKGCIQFFDTSPLHISAQTLQFSGKQGVF